MRKSQDRLLKDQNIILSDTFIEVCRNGKTNTLVRKRKMPLEDLVYSMINRRGLTLKLELRNYMKITHPGVEISKPGYLKQRMKLNPEAFKYLYQSHNKEFYQDPEVEPYTYNGFLVLALTDDGGGHAVHKPCGESTPTEGAVLHHAGQHTGLHRQQYGQRRIHDALTVSTDAVHTDAIPGMALQHDIDVHVLGVDTGKHIEDAALR